MTDCRWQLAQSIKICAHVAAKAQILAARPRLFYEAEAYTYWAIKTSGKMLDWLAQDRILQAFHPGLG